MTTSYTKKTDPLKKKKTFQGTEQLNLSPPKLNVVQDWIPTTLRSTSVTQQKDLRLNDYLFTLGQMSSRLWWQWKDVRRGRRGSGSYGSGTCVKQEPTLSFIINSTVAEEKVTSNDGAVLWRRTRKTTTSKGDRPTGKGCKGTKLLCLKTWKKKKKFLSYGCKLSTSVILNTKSEIQEHLHIFNF